MKRLLVALLVIGLLVGGGYAAASYWAATGTARQATPVPTPLPPVFTGDTVVAEAKVVPLRSAKLRFETSGTVQELLVREGDLVKQGQPLARLDARDLQLKVAEAKANLAQAHAAYDKLAAAATLEELAAAEATVAQSQAQLAALVGKVAVSDIVAAQAELAEAQAALDELLGEAKHTEVTQAQAALDAAQALLHTREVEVQQVRDARSKAKTDAERALQEAAINLQTAQADYSMAYWNYQNVQDKGRAPAQNEGQDNPELSDYGNLSAQEAFKQAELQLQAAQLALEQAQKDVEIAQQDEITAIAQAEQQRAHAEAQVREAQARLDDVLDGADNDEMARARADVVAAQAQLDALQGAERAGSIAAAEAEVANAQARLDAVRAPKRAVDLGEAKAQIQQAAVALQKATLDLAKATLTAPISGTVAAVTLDIGEVADSSQTAIALADLEQLEIETDDLTELQVVNVREGAPVTITFDALPNVELTGRVARIKALGENKQGDITYTVTVTPDHTDERLRWNMTAVVSIKTE